MAEDRVDHLLQERAGAIAEQRALLNAAETDGRDLTGEEQAEYDQRDADITSLEARIERLRAQAARDQAVDRYQSVLDGERAQPDSRLSVAELRASDEYHDAFWAAMRNRATPEQRNLLIAEAPPPDQPQASGVPQAGGFLIPTSFERRLIEYRIQSGAMLQAGVTVLTTSSGELIQLPKGTDLGEAFWIAESQGGPATAETFDQETVGAHTAFRRIIVPMQLVEDSAVDLEGYLARRGGMSLGSLINKALVGGDGQGKPTGILDPTKGIQGGAVGGMVVEGPGGAGGTITPDELYDIKHKVPVPYRVGCRWLMHDSTIKAIRKLTDEDGQYLWQPSLQAGDPDMLLGFPVLADPDIPEMAAEAHGSIVFGDFSCYTVREVAGLRLRRLDERYADLLQVGYIFWQRIDGILTDPNGLAAYDNGTAGAG